MAAATHRSPNSVKLFVFRIRSAIRLTPHALLARFRLVCTAPHAAPGCDTLSHPRGTDRLVGRRVLLQFPLQGAAMNAESTSRLGNIPAAVGQDAIDVFPLRPGQRGGTVLLR